MSCRLLAAVSSLALAGAIHADGVGPAAEVLDVSFVQIDWYDAPGVVVAEDSVWGEATITVAPGLVLSYVNIVANDNAGSPDEWIVRNVPISPASVDPAPQPESITFDLRLLGASDGVNFSVLEYYVTSDLVPRNSTPPPAGPIFSDVMVGDRTNLTGGGLDGGPGVTDPGEPQLPVDPPPAPASDDACDIKRTGVPNIEAEDAQCYPAMLANCLEWLSDYWQLGLADDADDIVDDLDDATGRVDGEGLFHKATLEGLLKYVKDKNLPVTVHFQSQWVGADVKKHGRTAKRDGGTPTFDYLKKELKKGQDVTLTYQRDGDNGAHGVVVTGAYVKKDGTKGVRFQDDVEQDKAGGTKSTPSDLGTNGTRMNVLARPKNKVTGIFSISPTFQAMLDAILRKCQQLIDLVNDFLALGGVIFEPEADFLVELTRILRDVIGNLFESIADLQPDNLPAQGTAHSALGAAEFAHEQALLIRQIVRDNPGQPVPEELQSVQEAIGGACALAGQSFELLERGACCLFDGGCVEFFLADECLSIGGEYLGDAAPCDPTGCFPRGSCCLPDGACLEVTDVECFEVGGDYQGDGTVCTGDPCGPIDCPGDVDGDLNVTFDDLLLLLSTWGDCPDPCPPSCPADLDGDCVVGFPDLLEVLANWGPCLK